MTARQSMPHDDSVYLQHILDCITRIEQYTANVDETNFKKDTLIQDGVIRQIEIIGEAVKCLSATFRSSHDQIRWQDMARMRDKLIHDYFGVDLEKVWLTVVYLHKPFRLRHMKRNC
jgi:uncharacterized protein with HEPN domain